jgi:hypothetical protein
MLWDKKRSIHNIEARWTVDELEKFQGPIPKLTEDVFNIANTDNVGRELALTMAQSASKFQDIIYKAACLDESDFTEHRLFIYIGGKCSPAGNTMNSPWDQLLVNNKLFSKVNYTLLNDFWSVLTTQGISYWKRFKVAGYETIIYRLAIKLSRQLPNWIFTKEVLMPNENELNIEIAAALALRGVKITNIQINSLPNDQKIQTYTDSILLSKEIISLMYKRIVQWVTPSGVEVTMSLFKSYMEKQIKEFVLLSNEWDKVIAKSDLRCKVSVLVNTPGNNIKGYALTYSCRKKNIPLISSQHGITQEIRNTKHILDVGFESNVADVMFTYNSKIINIEKNSYFSKSKYYEVGMPLRLIRMKNTSKNSSSTTPILFVSVNLYFTGAAKSPNTKYSNALAEQVIVVEVLSKLPHKVCYKTYPEDTRRHADPDPVLNDINKADNIEVFSKKIDLRYLISEYKVLVTSCATSTLGWLVMSGKPVVFINQKNNKALSDEAYTSLSKGLFVFNGDEKDFHVNIRNFLSQPIEKIEKLWQEKDGAREEMIRKYFSKYNGGAGKRAAKIILEECLV